MRQGIEEETAVILIPCCQGLYEILMLRIINKTKSFYFKVFHFQSTSSDLNSNALALLFNANNNLSYCQKTKSRKSNYVLVPLAKKATCWPDPSFTFIS